MSAAFVFSIVAACAAEQLFRALDDRFTLRERYFDAMMVAITFWMVQPL